MIGGCKEIRDEMIWQEILETDKSIQAIADEYQVNRSTVWRIKKQKEDKWPLTKSDRSRYAQQLGQGLR